MALRVRGSVESDVARIAQIAHPLDCEELWAGRRTPAECLAFGFEHSDMCVTAEVDAGPLCMVGVIPLGEGCGGLWMIATSLIDHHNIAFIRASRIFIKEAQARYASLENKIHASNVRLVNWVCWLGFDLDPPEPYGADGALFIRYHWTRECVTP